MSLYIGLMSGTSVDSVDAVLCRVEPINKSSISPSIENHAEQCILLAEHAHPIPESLQTAIHGISTQQYDGDPIEQLGALEYQLGHLFADAVQQLLAQTEFKASDIIAIGSHGQTIRHRPNSTQPFSLQIGDANIIATQTGITTVADFRRKDIALGGQGAPLVPCFHQTLFATKQTTQIILNLGGIANITVLTPDDEILGYDTGPANTLMDQWILRHQQQAFDHNGDWARAGTLIPDLLDRLLQHNYFAQPFPKSTGREEFNLEWLDEQLRKHQHSYTAEDVQRTLLELSAQTIADAVKIHKEVASQLICCGGGSHNSFFLERLSQLLPGTTVCSSQEYGADPDLIEAMAFAWLAYRRVNHLAGTAPTVTGATKPSILGAIYTP